MAIRFVSGLKNNNSDRHFLTFVPVVSIIDCFPLGTACACEIIKNNCRSAALVVGRSSIMTGLIWHPYNDGTASVPNKGLKQKVE